MKKDEPCPTPQEFQATMLASQVAKRAKLLEEVKTARRWSDGWPVLLGVLLVCFSWWLLRGSSRESGDVLTSCMFLVMGFNSAQQAVDARVRRRLDALVKLLDDLKVLGATKP